MTRLLSLTEAQATQGQLRQWAYNALDVTGTHEVWGVLRPRLSPNQSRIYAFERALQAPALSMMMRGVRVDVQKRKEMVQSLERELKKDTLAIAKSPLVQGVWDGVEKETGFCPKAFGKRHKWPRGVPDTPERCCERCGTSRFRPVAFNANSSSQVHHLLYELHGIPTHRNKTGEVSTDDDTLGRIKNKYPRVAPLCDMILAVRDKKKQLGTLNGRLTSDGRYPSSFNVGAAWTGRFSSSKSPFGQGGNLQNVAPRHRRVFIPDPGMDMFYTDFMRGESHLVAYLTGDPKYIEAHNSDTHTYVTRLLWPELPWTGDMSKDKKIAKALPDWDPVEGHDFRFQAKRIQHGSNYGLTPYGIAMIAKIPVAQAKIAYERYMTEFDYIPAWHGWMRQQVREQRPLINPLGREIELVGRPWDDSTWRQALAFLPQGTLADIEDLALWRVWRELEAAQVFLLAQVHDALLGQYPRGRLDLVRQVLQYMRIPVPVTDFQGNTRTMVIGVEAAVGRNWGHKGDDNPYGLDEAPIETYLKEHPLDTD